MSVIEILERLTRFIVAYSVLHYVLLAQSVNKIPICNILLTSNCATPPRILHGDIEKYVKKARPPQREGEIIIQFLVHTDGSVSDLQIIKSNADPVAARRV